MKFTGTFTVLATAGLFIGGAVAACDCHHNDDAGRWRDPKSPSGMVSELCTNQGGCHQSEEGNMCIQGDMTQCACAIEYAKAEESWHGDWFLWSAINCGDLSITMN